VFSVSDTTDIKSRSTGRGSARTANGSQPFAGVVPTLPSGEPPVRADHCDLNYQPVSRNPFDRLIDTDTPLASDNDVGGASVDVDFQAGPGTGRPTTSWRYWHWAPSNDRTT